MLQRTQTEVFNIAEYLRGIETNMDVLRIMLGAPSSAMNFISNDDAIELGIAVWDSKTGKPVDPAPVLERLAKARADAKIAASLPPAPAAPAPVSAGSDGGASPVEADCRRGAACFAEGAGDGDAEREVRQRGPGWVTFLGCHSEALAPRSTESNIQCRKCRVPVNTMATP